MGSEVGGKGGAPDRDGRRRSGQVGAGVMMGPWRSIQRCGRPEAMGVEGMGNGERSGREGRTGRSGRSGRDPWSHGSRDGGRPWGAKWVERAEQRTGTGGGPEATGVEGMGVGSGAGGKGGAGGAGGAGMHWGPLKSSARV